MNEPRTYGELVVQHRPACLRGTCCACHKWGIPVWRLSSRASICSKCCERKSGEVLGSILKSERRAKRWIKGHPNLHQDPKFLARLTGASLEFVTTEIAKIGAQS